MFIVGDFSVGTNSAIINPNIAVNNLQNNVLIICYTPVIDKYSREDKKKKLQLCKIIFIQM